MEKEDSIEHISKYAFLPINTECVQVRYPDNSCKTFPLHTKISDIIAPLEKKEGEMPIVGCLVNDIITGF